VGGHTRPGQVVAVFYALLIRTTIAAARAELLRTRAFVRMVPSRILTREVQGVCVCVSVCVLCVCCVCVCVCVCVCS
jgi:hypothetical protein